MDFFLPKPSLTIPRFSWVVVSFFLFLFFLPLLREDFPFDSYFSDGLVKNHQLVIVLDQAKKRWYFFFANSLEVFFSLFRDQKWEGNNITLSAQCLCVACFFSKKGRIF